jgi:predicted Zn-dependent protease
VQSCSLGFGLLQHGNIGVCVFPEIQEILICSFSFRGADADADAAMKLDPSRNVRMMAALAIAHTGDTAAAEKLAGELDKSFPMATLVQRNWLPAIRAAVALQREDPNRAIELLQPAVDVELGGGTRLIPAYLRGEAYLMLHDGNRAAAEFQKYIDHRSLVRNSPWGALAGFGLARAYPMQGDFGVASSRRTSKHPHNLAPMRK